MPLPESGPLLLQTGQLLAGVCGWPFSGIPACAPNCPGLGVKQPSSGHAQIFRV